MKNKRWKRESKRIIGRCLSDGCKSCKYLDKYISNWNEELTEECGFIFGIPPLEGYRKIENKIRNNN